MVADIGIQRVGLRKTKDVIIRNVLGTLLVFNLVDLSKFL
jgi:hypothetical protein